MKLRNAFAAVAIVFFGLVVSSTTYADTTKPTKTAAAKVMKRPGSVEKKIENPKPTKVTPPTGVWTDGLWHVVFGSTVDPRGCVTVSDLHIANGVWLYVCRDPSDDLFHVVFGDDFRRGFVEIDALDFDEGRPSYIAVEKNSATWRILGNVKTYDGMRSTRALLIPFGGGVDVVSRYDLDREMSAFPTRTSHGIEFKNYILAKGMPLVTYCESAMNCRVYWGEDESEVWVGVKELRFAHNQVEYIGTDKNNLLHVVTNKTIGRGCEDIDSTHFEAGGKATYDCLSGGHWYIMQNTTASQPYDETSTLYVVDGKPFYAARRNPAPTDGASLLR